MQKERSNDDEVERAAKKARAEPSQSPSTQIAIDPTSGSSSSPPAATSVGGAAVKQTIEYAWDADEAPEKTQKLNSVCISLGAADKVGESLKEEYEEDLKEMVEAYKKCSEGGECFVHIRKKQSSNRDLRALSCLTKGTKFYKVYLESSEIDSIIPNPSGILKMVKAADFVCHCYKLKHFLVNQERLMRWPIVVVCQLIRMLFMLTWRKHNNNIGLTILLNRVLSNTHFLVLRRRKKIDD